MKSLTSLLILACCMFCSGFVFAGENTSLKAEKICSPQIDIFNIDNIESLLGITGSEKIASYQIVLSNPGNIYKYDAQHSGDFKTIIARVKEHAEAGSILFVDEIKTIGGDKFPQALFYLR